MRVATCTGWQWFPGPHVAVATAAPVNIARVGQQRYQVLRTWWIADLVASLHLFEQHGKAHALTRLAVPTKQPVR